MDNPGTRTLFAQAITTAITPAVAQTPIEDLDGMAAVTLFAELLGATGGTSISALVQTSFDGGSVWLDVARFDFTTSAAKKWCVLQGDAAKAIASYAALSSEGVNDGLLSDRLRAVISSVGIYTNTTLSIRAAVR